MVLGSASAAAAAAAAALFATLSIYHSLLSKVDKKVELSSSIKFLPRIVVTNVIEKKINVLFGLTKFHENAMP